MNRQNVETSKRLDSIVAVRRGAARRSHVGGLTLEELRSRRFDVSRRGFTLIEAIATITVIAILGSIASFMLAPVIANHSRAATAAQLQMEVSLALDLIERELRAIQRDENAAGDAPDIAQITPTSISWHTNSNIALSGDELRWVEAGGQPRILLRDVTSFSIQAFNESNQPMAASLSGNSCDDVRRLAIALTIEREGVSQTLRTKVFLRSMMKGGTV